MTAIKVFLVSAYIAGLLLCVASFYAASPLLYTIGAVIAVVTVVTAMWATAITDLNPKEEDQ
jgi:hypothetical protein